jgi:hypothetical protein
VNPPDDVTLGEIARNVAALRADMGETFVAFRTDMRDGLAGVNRRLDTLEYVPRGEHNVEMREMKARVTDLEEARKWVGRTLVASFLFPVLVAAVIALVVTR